MRCLSLYISLNIIIDSINNYRYEQYVDLPTDKAFRRLSLLPRDLDTMRSDCLYICRLTDVMRFSTQASELYFLCLRDRMQDVCETKELLKNTIVINENLELDQLFATIQNLFVIINDWYQDMLEAVVKQKGMQDIITLSEPVIGNFISISDTALTLLAYTKNIPTDDKTQLSLVEHGHHTEEAIRKFKKYRRFEAWMNTDGLVINEDNNICQYPVISKVFAFNEIYFTHVVMICDHRKMTPGLLDLFNHMVSILSYYINRNWEEAKNCNHIYSSLILNLVQGNITDRNTVKDRARIIGFRPDDQYVIMLLTGGNSGDSISPRLMALDISNMFAQIRPVYYNGCLMLFLHHADIAQLMAEQDMENILNCYFQRNHYYCGVSEIFDDLLDMPIAHSQAELALNNRDHEYQSFKMIWESVSIWSNISHFSMIFASCLVDNSEKSKQLWKSWKYGKLLLDLYHSDVEKNTNNLEVLYEFLMNERRAAETANLLHMHRNNVVYRINRIEEMLNVNLEDRSTRLNLTMSYLMLKRSGIMKS